MAAVGKGDTDEVLEPTPQPVADMGFIARDAFDVIHNAEFAQFGSGRGHEGI